MVELGRRGLLIGAGALAATPVIGSLDASARPRGHRTIARNRMKDAVSTTIISLRKRQMKAPTSQRLAPVRR